MINLVIFMTLKVVKESEYTDEELGFNVYGILGFFMHVIIKKFFNPLNDVEYGEIIEFGEEC